MIDLLGIRLAIQEGPQLGITFTPDGSTFREKERGIAWKNGIASRERKSGAGATSENEIVSPWTAMPAIDRDRPRVAAFAPMMSWMNAWAGDWSDGFAFRLNASAKLCAV